MNPESDPAQTLRAILTLLAALLLFALLDATGKHLAQTYPIPMLVWARYALHLIFMIVVLSPRLGKRLYHTTRPLLQIVRASCLLGMTLLLMAAFKRMPLAETTAILFTTPLLVTLLAGPLLGERITPVRWVAVLTGFVGVLLVARPGGALTLEGAAFAACGAVLFAFYQLLTRRLAPTDHPVTMLFYTALVGAVVMSATLPWQWGGPLPDAFDALLIALLGVYGAVGHFLLTRAFHAAPASTLAPVMYVQLGWAALIGWVAFGDLPDGMTWLGIVVIVAAGVLIASDGRRARSASGTRR